MESLGVLQGRALSVQLLHLFNYTQVTEFESLQRIIGYPQIYLTKDRETSVRNCKVDVRVGLIGKCQRENKNRRFFFRFFCCFPAPCWPMVSRYVPTSMLVRKKKLLRSMISSFL
jgi:hypothetical protein